MQVAVNPDNVEMMDYDKARAFLEEKSVIDSQTLADVYEEDGFPKILPQLTPDDFTKIATIQEIRTSHPDLKTDIVAVDDILYPALLNRPLLQPPLISIWFK